MLLWPHGPGFRRWRDATWTRSAPAGRRLTARLAIPIGVVALILLAVGGASAQTQFTGECPRLVLIPGGSSEEDRTPHRCNLDNEPALTSSVDGLPTPMYARRVSAELSVVVNPDGRIDPELTRYALGGGEDSHFYDRLMESIGSLRFGVGRIDGAPVRYGNWLVVSAETRPDSIPSTLSWRYVRGAREDSIVGEWLEVEPEPPLTRDEKASVFRAVTRVLERDGVLDTSRSYCILFDASEADRDSLRAAIWEDFYPEFRSFGRPAPPRECERDVSMRRYVLTAPIRTGGGRTVVRASGDVLRSWPPGFDGRWRRGWRAYCVVPDAPEEWDGSKCRVSAIYTGNRTVDGGEELFSEPPPDDAPLEFALLARTVGSLQTDTLRSSTDSVLRLEERAIVVDDEALCTAGMTYRADAVWPGGGERIVFVTRPGTSSMSGRVELVSVLRPEQDSDLSIWCDPARTDDPPFALFTLSRVGEPLRRPVRFCLIDEECARSFVIDPDRHELAEGPQLRFRFSDLQPETRRGRHIRVRLIMDRVIDGLTPFVIVRSRGSTSSYWLRRTGHREFDWGLTSSPPLPPETEFWIYLVRWPGETGS